MTVLCRAAGAAMLLVCLVCGCHKPVEPEPAVSTPAPPLVSDSAAAPAKTSTAPQSTIVTATNRGGTDTAPESVSFEYAEGPSDAPEDPSAVPELPSNDEPLTPPQALARAAKLVAQGMSGSGEFQQALVQAGGLMPVIPAAVGDQPVEWSNYTLNQAGKGFDAIRFTSPLDTPADLVWGFVLSKELGVIRWYIVPSSGYMQGFERFEKKKGLDLGAIGLPNQTELVLQELVGGEIQPRQEYFLWFRFQRRSPCTLYVKLKLIPSTPVPAEQPQYRGAMTMATESDIGLPPDPPAGDAIISYAFDVWNVQGIDAAIKLLEDRIRSDGKAASRWVRYRHVEFTLERAIQWARTPETRDAAYRSFRETATLMRALQQDVGSLQFDERETFGRILFYEACTLLAAGQPDQAAASVQEAIENRIDPRGFPKDPLGDALRELPQFVALLQTLDERR